MVDRTMAGTAGLKPGRIELLHARRLLYDDQDALEVVLNETYDAPPTIYTMQMFDRRFEEPLQRRQQASNDAPPLLFFSFDFQFKGLKGDNTHQPLVTRRDLEEVGVPLHLAGATKMEMFPYSTNVFFVRLENLADDDFDTYWEYYEHHEDDEDIDIPEEDIPEERRLRQRKYDYDEKHLKVDDLSALLV